MLRARHRFVPTAATPGCFFFLVIALAVASCGRCGGAQTTFAELSLRGDASCGRTRDGRVFCWGDDAFRTRTVSSDRVPAPVRTTPTEVARVAGARELSIGASHGCVRVADGTLACWRDPTSARVDTHDPLEAPMHGGPFALLPAGVQLASSANTTCVRTAAGTVACFDFRQASALEAPAWQGVVAVAAGDIHRCAITREKRVVCTGMGDALGGATDGGEVPGLADVDELRAGSAYTCARSHGRVSCWGSNSKGQTGQPSDGMMSATPAPVEVAGVANAIAITAGVYHSCAVLADHTVKCWGDDRFGQVAGATGGVSDVVQVEVGEWHTCALRRDGTVLCWGRNHRGQLGDGSTTDSRTPVAVSE